MSMIDEKLALAIIEGDDEARVSALSRIAERRGDEYRMAARRLLILATLMRNHKVPDRLTNLIGLGALLLAEQIVTARK